MKGSLLGALFTLVICGATVGASFWLVRQGSGVDAATVSAIESAVPETVWAKEMIVRVDRLTQENDSLRQTLRAAEERIVEMETVYRDSGDRISITNRRVQQLEQTVEQNEREIDVIDAVLFPEDENTEALVAEDELAEEDELTLDDFITIVLEPIDNVAGPHLLIEGANVHVRSGSGATDDRGAPTGLGNLNIGYNEPDETFLSRTGSHNLVVGAGHGYASFGGLVTGSGNNLVGELAAILGGTGNEASGFAATVVGGDRNRATGELASVNGGTRNEARGFGALVSGGDQNQATGEHATATGGLLNLSEGLYASVLAGERNHAVADISLVAGGSDNRATTARSGVALSLSQGSPGEGRCRVGYQDLPQAL